ncbi:MAG: BamA/TamA family outer membrane protein [bacterium]|nr:BamA/TamA family outer membrane protein [bacterium]
MRSQTLLKTLAVCTVLVFGSGTVFAQEYFGKNKVNYNEYDWHVIETEHFSIYFDKDALPAAEFAAKEAERSLVRIEKELKYDLKNKYPIVIYNSHNGFSVSNITPYEQSEFTGGYTEFSQGRVVLPFSGSYADFRHVIHHELAHAVTVELWTGGQWLGSIAARPSTLPPLWIAEGVAEYLSQGGWDVEADNFMRDATISGYVPPIEQLSYSYFAYKGGQSVFYMIEQEFDKEKVAEFISSYKTARSVDKALKASLGIGLEELDEKWQLWLKRQFWNEINLHEEASEVSKVLTDRKETRSAYNLSPTLSPQGDKVVYLTDRDGTFDVRLMSAIDGKDLGRLVEGEKSSAFESMFVLRPGFTWSPDGQQVAFAAKSNNKNTLYTMHVKKRKVTKRFKFDLDGMFEPTWSPDGKKIAVVGIKNGWSDIYVVDLETETLEQITNDPYDEKHLAWSPDGEWIAVSSDRPDLELAYNGKKDFPFGQYDVFVIRTDGTEIKRVVSGESQETHPAWGPESKRLAFISDRTGVGNIYIQHLDSTDVYPVTNLLSSARDLDWSADGKKMTFATFHKGGLDIFILKDPKRKEMADLPLTRFAKREVGMDERGVVEQQQARLGSSRSNGETVSWVSDRLDQTNGSMEETVSKGWDDYFVQQWTADQVVMAVSDEPEVDVYGEVEAEQEAAKEQNWEKEFEIQKYKLKFKPDFFAAQAGFDTFYGVSSLVTLAASDMLGDHQMSLSTSLNFSLKDSDLFLSYAYLKKRTNYYTQLFHTRSFFYNGGVLNADRYYGLAGTMERPFNRFTRLELSAQFVTVDRELFSGFSDPFVQGGFFGGPTRGQDGTRVDRQRAVLTELALVDDTTLNSRFGPVDGRRVRLSAEGSKLGMEFATLMGDYRTYKKMGSDYTFAFRMSGGTSFGDNRTRFFVGGVNNPINPTFSTIATVPTDEIFFSKYVWPLRGAELFESVGDSFVLANLAFRFPLIHQLAMGWPLPLFFQNVQGELFLDIGSAFDRGNFNPWESRDGGFELRDLTAGYGLGVRVDLGMFLFRYDIAWPTDFAESFHPKQYFSIDFTGLF